MLVIKVQKGNLSRALKQFKRKFKKTGILKELRERQYHIKKSIKQKVLKEQAIYKQKYKEENDE